MIIQLLIAIAASSTPATAHPICVKTTILPRGRFINSEIVTGSGDVSMDRLALVTVGNMNLARLFPEIERQTGYLIARPDGKGSLVLEFTGKLLESCPGHDSTAGNSAPASGT